MAPSAPAGTLRGMPTSAPRVAAGHLHGWLYERSGGRLGRRMAGHPVLLLTTTGRRSGRRRRTPVQYERVGGELVLAAAAGGSPAEPAWCRNLREDPRVRVRLGASESAALARVAAAEERARLWPELCVRNPALEQLQRKAGREIPLVVLELGSWAGSGA
jgi:deazaflavin-dependent oxidoreductase (nitroreductase family)